MGRRVLVLLECDADGCERTTAAEHEHDLPVGWYMVEPPVDGDGVYPEDVMLCSALCLASYAGAQHAARTG